MVLGKPEKSLANLVVLNLVNFYLVNRVQTVQQTATKLCLGSKMLHLTCSGNCSSSLTNLASDWLKAVSSPDGRGKKLGQQHMADSMNVLSLSLRRK